MYKIELNKEQLRCVLISLEEYFRLRLGQFNDLAYDLACLNCDKYNLTSDEFNSKIKQRDIIESVMRGLYTGMYNIGIDKKTEDMMIIEDMWDSIRCYLGESRFEHPLHIGSEPPIKIEKIKE